MPQHFCIIGIQISPGFLQRLIGINANGMQNTICATMMEERPSGNLMAAKKLSVATAVAISGTNKGRLIMPILMVCPPNFPLASTNAAMVANSTEKKVAMLATNRLLKIAFWIFSFENALTYHLVLNSVHT